MIEWEWPDGKPIPRELTVTEAGGIFRYPDPERDMWYCHEDSGLVRLTIEGPKEDVEPFMRFARKHLQALRDDAA